MDPSRMGLVPLPEEDRELGHPLSTTRENRKLAIHNMDKGPHLTGTQPGGHADGRLPALCEKEISIV